MLVRGRLFLYLILIWSSSLLLNIKGDILNTKEGGKRQIFPLLSYLHGYKIGQNFALQLPPFVLSPVIIVPLNLQQSTNIQKSDTDESFQENGGTFQTNFPVKLTLNSSLEDIQPNIKLRTENFTLQGDITGINDTFRQINVNSTASTENATEKVELASTTSTSSVVTDKSENVTKPTNPTDLSYGFYPVPAYDNEIINSLQITTPLATALKPTDLVDKDENIESETQNTEIETSGSEKIGNKLLESGSSRDVSFQLTTDKYYVRPNTRYYNPHSFWHNAIADQSSITLNSYREEEKELPLPPRYDDRWRRFSSLSKVVLPASGFKPLAGLYYDGFLHKSVTKKTGFIPFDKYYSD